MVVITREGLKDLSVRVQLERQNRYEWYRIMD